MPRVPPGPTASASGTLASTSPAHTRSMGRALGEAAAPGTLVALIGPLGAGKTVVEWADRLGDWLPDERLEIELIPDGPGNRRRLRWTAFGQSHERLAQALTPSKGRLQARR